MRRIVVIAAVALAVGACDGTPSDRTPSPTGAPTSSDPSPSSPTVVPSSSVSQEPTTVALPPGTPDALTDDVAADELDPAGLIPRRADVEEAWIVEEPEAIVVAYVVPGDDPFRADRGTLVWRRFGDPPAWRAVAWFPTSAESGVLGVDGIVADVTGDGLEDVLFGAFTGGSGSCARWSVVDVDAADEVFGKDLCDGRIDPSLDPDGLSIEQAVYRVGDPHCCPSAFKTTVLTYDGDGTWTVASKDVRDTP
jgi:hypothetical protein